MLGAVDELLTGEHLYQDGRNGLRRFRRRRAEFANQVLTVHGADLIERNLSALVLKHNSDTRGVGPFRGG